MLPKEIAQKCLEILHEGFLLGVDHMQKLADLQGELLTGDRPMIHSPESIRKPDVMERIAYLQYQRVLRDGTYSKLESVLTTHKKSLKVKSEKKAPKPPARKGKKLAMELPPNAS